MAWIELTLGNGDKTLVNTDTIVRVEDREEKHGGGADLHLLLLNRNTTMFFTVKEKRGQVASLLAASGIRVGR